MDNIFRATIASSACRSFSCDPRTARSPSACPCDPSLSPSPHATLAASPGANRIPSLPSPPCLARAQKESHGRWDRVLHSSLAEETATCDSPEMPLASPSPRVRSPREIPLAPPCGRAVILAVRACSVVASNPRRARPDPASIPPRD
jgi:hypothetical protein